MMSAASAAAGVVAAEQCRKRRAESPPPKGRSNAARVSRGSEVDVWNGLTVAQPKRNKSEHVTITVVIYNTCEGGVPTEEDVVAAIDDLEELYAACSVKGRLADAPFGFMKEKLAVEDMVAVTTKLATQPPPFVPSSVDVANAFTFPSDESAAEREDELAFRIAVREVDGEDASQCTACREELKQIYDQEKEEWIFVGVCRRGDGSVVHRSCR